MDNLEKLCTWLTKQGAPGPPPRLGLVWKPETHRWIHPEEENIVDKIMPHLEDPIERSPSDFKSQIHKKFNEYLEDKPKDPTPEKFLKWMKRNTGLIREEPKDRAIGGKYSQITFRRKKPILRRE